MKRVFSVLQTTAAKITFLVIALTFCVWAIVAQWDQIVSAMGEMRTMPVVAAAVAGVVYVLWTYIAWHELLQGCGVSISYVKSSRIFFVSQLGKYLPGGVWNFLAAAELGKGERISRVKSTLVMFASLLISIATGILIGSLALVFGPQELRQEYWWVIFLLPLALVGLTPRVLNRVANTVMSRFSKDSAPVAFSGKSILKASGWTVIAWLFAGLQIWLLATTLGWDASANTFLLAAAAYALAWVAGFVLVFAPAGIGVREAVLGAVLSASVGAGGALVVVLLSRVLLTFTDVALGLVAIFIARRNTA